MTRVNLLFMIATGGALGAVSRYLLSTVIRDRFSTNFPVGTFMINLIGCFLIGFFLKNTLQSWKTFFIIGFLGSFTTFSTFASDIYDLLRSGNTFFMLVYILGSNLIGVIMVYLGAVCVHVIGNK